MKDIKVLVSACGAPGCSTLIRYLRGVKERNVFVVGVDADPEAVGRFLSNKFHKVPLATDKDYITAIFDIIKREEIDAFYCVSSAEIGVVSAKKEYLEQEGCVVLASGKREIEIAENKALLYEKLSAHGIPTPKAFVVKTLNEFTEAVGKLGYPDERVCFKPPVGKGSRGFRILDESVNRRDLLMNHKPNSLYMSLDEFLKIFKNDGEQGSGFSRAGCDGSCNRR